MLRCDGIHDDSDASLQPVESNSEDSSGESQDKVENIEFDSDESVENNGVEDDTIQGPTAMMNRSWLQKLFSLLDADLGLEGRFVSMRGLYNSWLSAMRPTHWSNDDENVLITAAN